MCELEARPKGERASMIIEAAPEETAPLRVMSQELRDMDKPVGDASSGIAVAPDTGVALLLGTDRVVLKLDGATTGGALAVVEHQMEPGTLGPPHIHEHENELSYVLEGEIGIRIGDRDFRLTQGMYVFKPCGMPHAFWNPGPGRAHILEIICPAGSEQFFADMARQIRAGEQPDSEEVARIAGRYRLAHLESTIAHMVASLDDLLDVARTDAGR